MVKLFKQLLVEPGMVVQDFSTPAVGRQRLADRWEFKISMVYIKGSWIVKAT